MLRVLGRGWNRVLDRGSRRAAHVELDGAVPAAFRQSGRRPFLALPVAHCGPLDSLDGGGRSFAGSGAPPGPAASIRSLSGHGSPFLVLRLYTDQSLLHGVVADQRLASRQRSGPILLDEPARSVPIPAFLAPRHEPACLVPHPFVARSELGRRRIARSRRKLPRRHQRRPLPA